MKKETKPELCSCKKKYPVMLQYSLDKNLFSCSNCNLFVKIKEGILTSQELEEINQWAKEYKEKYGVWLKSELDDNLSLEKLVSKESRVNKLGLKIVENLSKKLTIYYWWHNDNKLNDKLCPSCNNEMNKIKNSFTEPYLRCENCLLIITRE